ncbi:MAG TPA: hypothetical protein VK168_13670 [Saprospiraceae bacterium]|nr:hypothetical protein [Saprospiraceae bacterium]
MKKLTIVIPIIIAVFSIATFSRCDSASQKSKEAKENVVDAKADLKTAENEAALAAQKAADAAEWKQFKSDSEVKIMDNENQIARIKEKMKTSGKKLNAAYTQSIEELEQKNKNLKARMEAYEKGQTDWQSFKSEFNHDMNELGKALSDLTVDNKK